MRRSLILLSLVTAMKALSAKWRERQRYWGAPNTWNQCADELDALIAELPKRDVPALVEALRIRAMALTGEKWERVATTNMMKEAADMIEELAARSPSHD